MGPNDLFDSEEGKKILANHGLSTDNLNNLNFKGLPYKGKPYTVDKHSIPELKREVFIKQFDLSKEEDMKEYQQVFQRRADGLNQISFEEKVYDAELKSWRVLLRWYDIYYVEPKKKKGVDNV